jgi:hypothetical protein
MVRSYKARFCEQTADTDVLGPHAIAALHEDFTNGMPIWKLAEEYNIPERMVIDLLAGMVPKERSAVDEEMQNQRALERIKNPLWQPHDK